MSWIQSFYKTKNLTNNGLFIIGFSVILLVVGLLIPETPVKGFENQLGHLSGLNLKFNDTPEVSEFIGSIKRNNGYLILGTSESTSITGGNYYTYLNNDKYFGTAKFSVLAGAGRTCGLHLPVLLTHKEEVKNLNVIYFINPVYWRSGLNKITESYWNRYTNYQVINSIDEKDKNQLSWFPLEKYSSKLNVIQKGMQSSEYWLRNLRENYFNNLRYWLSPSNYKEGFNFISKSEQNDYSSFDFTEIKNLDKMDTNFNVLKSFKDKHWFNVIYQDETYRYEELQSFITVCKNLGIHATFVLGPVNNRFIQSYQPQALASYSQTTDNIRELLISNNVNYVDASDISDELGAFNDHQHHSAYGAYLIYLKIKANFHEEIFASHTH